jgi:hypothetical protein
VTAPAVSRAIRRVGDSRTVLVAVEGWNLVVIGVALVGFNYVPALHNWGPG